MEQRRVRLGDIVDDYCPRERRVTNHAVVAMIEDEIRLTRCTACDAEHPYKAARIPRTRQKATPAALSAAILAGRGAPEIEAPEGSGTLAGPDAEPDSLGEAVPDESPVVVSTQASVVPEPISAPAEERALAPDGEQGSNGAPREDGPVRRPLIRATLPRPEGQVTARPVPEFTMRQSGVRGSRLIENGGRGDQHTGRPGGNGSRPPQHARHGHRHGSGGGHGAGRGRGPQHHESRYDRAPGRGGRGNRPGQPTRGGKKRSR
jgi:hypothetical protein